MADGPVNEIPMRTWLARLTFPFFVLGFLLAWEGYKATGTRATLYFAGAAVVFAAGAAALRERHRPPAE